MSQYLTPASLLQLQAMVPIVSDLKLQLSSVLQMDVPARVQKALEPILELMQELRSEFKRRKSPATPRSSGLSPGREQEDKPRGRAGSWDAGDKSRRISAPLNAARIAVGAKSLRLGRIGSAVEVDRDGPASPSRPRPVLSVGSTRSRLLHVQVHEADSPANSPANSPPPEQIDRKDTDISLAPSPASSPSVPLRMPDQPQLEVFGRLSRSSSKSSEDRQNDARNLPTAPEQHWSAGVVPAPSRALGPLAPTFFGPTRTNHEDSAWSWQHLRFRPSTLWIWLFGDESTRRNGDSLPKLDFLARNKRRRNAVVLHASDVHELSRKARRATRSCNWPCADPAGQPRQYWDILAFTLLFLQVLYLCFQAAFITKEDYQMSNYFELKVALLVVDAFWVIDIGLNFTTGYRDSLQVLHCDAWCNAKRYLQSWFFLDLLATLPSLVLHSLLVASYSQHDYSSLRWLAFSPLARAPKFANSWSTLRRMEANLKSSLLSSVWSLFQLFMLPVIFSHFSACALWSLGQSNLERDPTSSSWIKKGLDISDEPGALLAVPLGERYMTSMYFAVTVMSTVGLGDINMSLVNERGLLCVIMATTSLVVGVAVSGVTDIVSKLNRRTAVTKERLAKVSKFLRAYGVPGDLQSRVHTYLLQFFENQDRDETNSMLMQWLKKSEVLRVNVNLALTGTCLSQHYLLKLVPRTVLANICDICDMESWL